MRRQGNKEACNVEHSQHFINDEMAAFGVPNAAISMYVNPANVLKIP